MVLNVKYYMIFSIKNRTAVGSFIAIVRVCKMVSLLSVRLSRMLPMSRRLKLSMNMTVISVCMEVLTLVIRVSSMRQSAGLEIINVHLSDCLKEMYSTLCCHENHSMHNHENNTFSGAERLLEGMILSVMIRYN